MLTTALAVSSLFGMPGTSYAKDTLIWLLRDMPPVTIFSGPDQGKGAMDQLLPLLMARMPEYEHLLMHVNRARGMQMLREESFTCDPTLLWTPERAKIITFSIPTYAVRSNGLIIQRQDIQKFAPFMDGKSIDLTTLLESKSVRLGIVAERSYGLVIDPILKSVPQDALNLHYGNDAIGSLLQMERMGRLDALISYWPEARYQAHQQGMQDQDLMFLPVKGVPKYQFTHIGCSNTPQGRQAMDIINREMRVLRKTRLIDLYAQWLPAPQRKEYLQDAKAFFDEP
jgi:uncharacterized protein (TIGR02285 family)